MRLKHGLGSLEPTIEVVQVCIPLEPVTNLLSKADAATVPAHVGQHSFGVDGTSYELILGGHFMEARFRWWHKVPTGWEPLWTLSAESKAFLDNAIAASSRQKQAVALKPTRGILSVLCQEDAEASCCTRDEGGSLEQPTRPQIWKGEKSFLRQLPETDG